MNEENSSTANFDEEESEEEQFDDSPVEFSNAQSRARNRTVMLTPEMTGQVRALIQEEAEEDHNDFMRPGQTPTKMTPVEPASFAEPIEAKPEVAQGLGLKFGESTNRAATTKFTREELDQVLKPSEEFDLSQIAQEPAVDFQNAQTTSQPTVTPSATKFDPLTTLAPSNFDSLINMKRPPASPPRNDNFQSPMPPLSQSLASTEVVQESASQVPFGGDTMVPSGSVAPPSESPAPTKTVKVVEKAVPTAKIVGFLICYDENEFGEVFEIRAGRKLITSRPTDHGEYLLIDDETVSPLHAILRATKEGKVQVLDQLSEYGTGVIRKGQDEEIEVSGGLEEIFDGDVVRFGEREFQVCMIRK